MAAHPTFAPDRTNEAIEFFVDQNYVVVSDALPPENIDVLRNFVDRSEREIPGEWGPDKFGCRSHAQILVYHPELDDHVRPAVASGLVDEIMGPETRFAQFDFRDLWEGETEGQQSLGQMVCKRLRRRSSSFARWVIRFRSTPRRRRQP